MKYPAACAIEILEARIAPATLDVSGRVATYTASSGVANSLVLSLDAGNFYHFADTEEITLTATAIASGFTFLNGNKSHARGPAAQIDSLIIKLGDGNDALEVQGIVHSLSVLDGAGFDSIAFTSGESSGAAMDLRAESVAINAPLHFDLVSLTLLSGGDLTQSGFGGITANTLRVEAAGPVSLDGPNHISLFSATVTGPGAGLSLSDEDGFQIVDALSVTGTLSFNTGAIFQAAGAPLSADKLVLRGPGPFAFLDPENHINTLAADTQGEITFYSAAGFTVGTVGSVSGISTQENLTLVTDRLSIAAPISAASVLVLPHGETTLLRLGGDDAPGTLGLTDAELDFISTLTLRIGGEDTLNSIEISSAISPAHTTILKLQGGAISGAGGIAVKWLEMTSATAVSLPAANAIDLLSLTSSATGGTHFIADADGFSLVNPLGEGYFAVLGTTVLSINAGGGTVIFPAGMSLALDLDGTNFGLGHATVEITGAVSLSGATLAAGFLPPLPANSEFILIHNDGTDAVIGTFAGLAEGDLIPGVRPASRITYHGGDGNDVAILSLALLARSVSSNGKTITLRDIDGDLVTVTTSKGTFDGTEVSGIGIGPHGEGRFERLTLGPEFKGANITITAKAGPLGGNGFVNLGYLDASGVDLGSVTIKGDVARLSAGTIGGNSKVPALRALNVQSLGLLGETTLGLADKGAPGLQIQGTLSKLAIKGDMRAGIHISGEADGILGSATIGGSVVGNLQISAWAGIRSMRVQGDIRAEDGAIFIRSLGGPIGALSVGGGIDGTGGEVLITAFGQRLAPVRSIDLAIRSLSVKGSVENTLILAGAGLYDNADASIGSILVGGDWIASSAIAGTGTGNDGLFGTEDDMKLFSAGLRDTGAIYSRIGSLTIKGQALGTTSGMIDSFGIVAERIAKAKIDGRSFHFIADKGAVLHREAFAAALTGDFYLRELSA